MKNSILIIAVISLSVFACKNKEKDQPTPKSSLSEKQTMLIGKDWKIKTIVTNGTDITSMVPACVMDNIVYHFTDASKGYDDEGATKCEASDDQRRDLAWKLENNETRMIVTDIDGKDTFDIMSVTGTEWKIVQDKNIITLKN
jgi:hypothetical protein